MREDAAGLHVSGGNQQDGVAIDDVAERVAEERAVGVAVEGDAKVEVAGSGEQGLRLAKDLRPAIITLDARRCRSDARRQAIIAVNARNLLDQVHLALYVHPP